MSSPLVNGHNQQKAKQHTPIEEIVIPRFKNNRPSILKKGDVFLGMACNYKARPMVVAIVKDKQSYCIPLTTTKDENTLIPHTSRFFEAGYFCNSFVVVKNDFISSAFIGVLDNNSNLNKAVGLIKERYKKELGI